MEQVVDPHNVAMFHLNEEKIKKKVKRLRLLMPMLFAKKPDPHKN